jgi:hypothetical protein
MDDATICSRIEASLLAAIRTTDLDGADLYGMLCRELIALQSDLDPIDLCRKWARAEGPLRWIGIEALVSVAEQKKARE